MSPVGVALLVTLLVFGSTAYGDMSPPAHKCIRPLKQTAFATQAQLERYKVEVELYRSCLEAFIKEQEQAIEVHRQAAQQAIDEWNKFVGEKTK